MTSINNNSFSGSVVASEAMFRTLAKTHIKYSWAYTFAKEIWQNTVDLDEVSTLDIITKVVSAPTKCLYDWIEADRNIDYYSISFQDNGPGMSLDLLKSVYLYYGETTKAHNEDSIGGYGLGRVVCTFGAVNYRLRSRDWECVGKGGQYEVTTNLPWVDGFLIEAVIPGVDRSGHSELADEDIAKYIHECYSSRITVNLNGNTLPYKYQPTEEKVLLMLGEAEWGTIQYVNTSSSYKSLRASAVNKHGDSLFLFEDSLYNVPYLLEVKVNAGITKLSMDISRSSFSGEYESIIEEIKRSLAKDLKIRTEERTFMDGNFPNPKTISAKVEEFEKSKDSTQGIRLIFTGSSERSTVSYGSKEGLPYMVTCTELEKPEMDTLKSENLKSFYEVWTSLIDLIVFDVLASILPSLDGSYVNTGILLSKNSLGVCSKNWKTHTLAANPYKIKSFGMLVATAMHEACHVGFMSHNEDFSCALSNLNGAMYGVTFNKLEQQFLDWQLGFFGSEQANTSSTTPKPIKRLADVGVTPTIGSMVTWIPQDDAGSDVARAVSSTPKPVLATRKNTKPSRSKYQGKYTDLV